MDPDERASKFKGVSWDSATEKWSVTMHINSSAQKFLGSFDSEEAAAHMYDTEAEWLGMPRNFAPECLGEVRSEPRNNLPQRHRRLQKDCHD